MANDLLNYDPSAGELPPQAPSPVGTLASLAEPPIVPVTPVEDLRRANFGDTGAAQYDALVQAGAQRPAAGLAGMANVPVAPSGGGLPGGTSGGVAGDLMQLFGDVLSGAASKPGHAGDAAAARALLQQREQSMRIQQQQAMQQQGAADMKFLDDLKGIPFENRADMASEYFARQGRPVPPSIARLITSDSVISQLTSPENIARLSTDPAFATRLALSLPNGPAFVKFLAGLRADEAETNKKIDDAAISHVKAAGALPNELLTLAKNIRDAGRMPTDNEARMADAAGMQFVRTAIPGVQGGAMWDLQPKGAGGVAQPASAPAGRISAADFLKTSAPSAPGAAAPASAAPATAPTGTIDVSKLDTTSQRSPREHLFQQAAKDKLDAEVRAGKRTSYTDMDVLDEVERLRATKDAAKTEAVKTAGLVSEGIVQATRGLALLNLYSDAAAKYGLATDKTEANLVQPLTMLYDRVTSDPAYSELASIDSTLSNVARGLGEKGVLTDPDVARVATAVKPRLNDTVASYQGRVNFVKEAIKRSNEALIKARDAGRAPQPVSLHDVTYEGEKNAPQGARPVLPSQELTGTAPPQ